MKITNEDNMDLMARYPDNYFDLAIVDPPYGIERFKKCKENIDINTKDVYANKFLKGESFNNTKPSIKYWDELFRVSKNQIVWGANNFTMPESEYFLIWDKKQSMPNFARCEYAWVSMGLKKPAKIFEYSIHKHNQIDKIHQTQKPVSLYQFILDNYAKPNDKILDTHLGSGSIAIACHDYGFDLTACELDKEYYDKAMQRINNHVAQQKLF
jgi:site-specific DNA-methyltransferase (adenine-specific)